MSVFRDEEVVRRELQDSERKLSEQKAEAHRAAMAPSDLRDLANFANRRDADAAEIIEVTLTRERYDITVRVPTHTAPGDTSRPTLVEIEYRNGTLGTAPGDAADKVTVFAMGDAAVNDLASVLRLAAQAIDSAHHAVEHHA